MTTPQPWHRSYDPGVPPELEFEDLTLPQAFVRSVQRHADRPALVFLNAAFTYRALESEVARCAGALLALGVKVGDRVAIQLPNLPQTVIAFQAAMRVGAVVVMTNPLYTLREVEHQWSDAGVSLAITSDFTWMEVLREHSKALAPKTFVVASIPEYLRFPLNWLAPLKLARAHPKRYAKFPDEPGVHRFRKLLARATPLSTTAKLGLDDVALLQYTGGTTGPAKGAMLTQRNLSFNVQQTAAWFTGCEPGREVMMTALPLFHVFGLTVCMNFGLWVGAKLVVQPNPRDIPALVKAIEKHRVTLFPAVPALFGALCDLPGIERHDLSSVKSCFSGSAPIAPEVLKRFEGLTGATIVEGFGMSETSPVTHCNPLGGTRKIGTVGVPVSSTDARIVDANDGVTEVPLGSEGELVIGGPQVMRGYWNRPDETAAALRGGYMHTGDLATMDADGYFKIVGRKKDMINVGGLKVFPDEVDAVLMAHPEIVEAATIGVPDPKKGEIVKSFVVLRPGSTLDAKAVEAHARENLSPYKVPREIEFLAELPKSSVLKILRRELRDRELAKRDATRPRS
jgi:long-chain acyl-CoA synthetase